MEPKTEQPKQYTPKEIAADVPITQKDSRIKKIIPPVILALALILPVVCSVMFLSGVHDVNQVDI